MQVLCCARQARTVATVIATTTLSMLAASCTWQQGYTAAQGWQRNACNRLVEQVEREHCLSNTTMTYDDYQRRQVVGRTDQVPPK